jgi:hypothetical protein
MSEKTLITIIEHNHYNRLYPENARQIFRNFCKAHLPFDQIATGRHFFAIARGMGAVYPIAAGLLAE